MVRLHPEDEFIHQGWLNDQPNPNSLLMISVLPDRRRGR
ncbi:hypothetical protein SAMCFNEI73_pB0375 (plasmid) [Sinorhizobium americanum]|uniref:Uncharacterized protein n=1 Tax=Sinorhizobium americanum TaxID=194963 RepID=A0A1L3LTZ9_9HYPH|nr:hypothetical protein SAMCCGM7_pB0344 [Sinorhizobium americanum CCGM7]APG93571.1 hypothetical protein SAMCFNEI73_pB0375 [Sinorhizobium americanum]